MDTHSLKRDERVKINTANHNILVFRMMLWSFYKVGQDQKAFYDNFDKD